MDFGQKQAIIGLLESFAIVEKKFKLLQWIDKEILEGAQSIDMFFHSLASQINELAPRISILVYTLVNGKMDILGPVESEVTGPPILPKSLLDDEGKTWECEDYEDISVTRLFIKINKTDNSPMIILVLEADYHKALGNPQSALHDSHFQIFMDMVGKQTSILLKKKIDGQLETLQKKVYAAFLNDQMDADKSWREIVALLAGFLPNWGHFKLTTEPNVQILTYRSGDKYIKLRAGHTAGKQYNAKESLDSFKILRRDSTICGLYLGMKEAGKTDPYLDIDPSSGEHKERYAAYLFEKTVIPKSELVVPIYDDGVSSNPIIGLINVEHPDPGVFTKYHIQMMMHGAEFLAPIVKALLQEENEHDQAASKFRYIITKVITRFAKTYHHKIKNQIAVSQLALEALARPVSKLEESHQLFFKRLQNSVASVAMLATDFLRDMPSFLVYGKQRLLELVNEAVAELDLAELKRAEGIDITIGPAEEEYVLASQLLREHIFNLLNNSLYAIRERIKSGEINAGKIEITIRKEDQKDIGGKVTSYPFAILEIKDNGGGMSEEDATKLARGPHTSNKIGGSGFGVWSAKDYMAQIDGNLEWDNKLGVGLTIVLKCPIYTQDRHEALTQQLNASIIGGK